jgi:hypothetical protein
VGLKGLVGKSPVALQQSPLSWRLPLGQSGVVRGGVSIAAAAAAAAASIVAYTGDLIIQQGNRV